MSGGYRPFDAGTGRRVTVEVHELAMHSDQVRVVMDDGREYAYPLGCWQGRIPHRGYPQPCSRWEWDGQGMVPSEATHDDLVDQMPRRYRARWRDRRCLVCSEAVDDCACGCCSEAARA